MPAASPASACPGQLLPRPRIVTSGRGRQARRWLIVINKVLIVTNATRPGLAPWRSSERPATRARC